MSQKTLFRGSVLPMAVLATALVFPPAIGLQRVQAVTQQSRQNVLRGTIVDEKGEPIIGATVMVVGAPASQGTITDLDGNFSVNTRPGTQLKISYVGYEPQTVAASNGMKVTLKEESTTLKGVEVVAYGVQKKVSVTGALSSIKSETLTRTPMNDVSNVLGGALSGVTTVQYSGEPGSDAATIYVRGQATFNNADPLVQVDGVERSLSDVDPEEIESITVLKDASATAVFGVRGANGVILITTKRGSDGPAKISGSTSWGVLTPTKMVEQANSYEYATFHNQMREADGLEPQFSESVLEKFRTGSDPIRFPSTVWTDYIMKKATLQTKHNLNISGGTKTARYFINFGYYTQGGLFKEFGQPYHFDYRYHRFNYRANLDLDVTRTTTVSFNMAGNVGSANKPYTGQGSSGMIEAAYEASPFSSPGIINGRYVTTETAYDGLTADEQLPFTGSSGITYFGNATVSGGYMNTVTNKLQFDLNLKQKLDFITKGLSFHIKGSYNGNYEIDKNARAAKATYTPVLQDDGTYKYKKTGNEEQLTYSESTSKARYWYMEAGFNWNRSFGLHNLGALVLYNQDSNYYPSTYSSVPKRQVGLVGRLTYDWSNRYLFEFNIGYNGNENFAPGKRYGIFPAFSGGWVVSDEPFFKPVSKVISFMKLRASYGIVGNGNIGGSRFMYTADPYVVNNSGSTTTGGYGYWFGINNNTIWQGAYESALHNPDVTWERAYKQNYGVDINFLKDKLRATFDYYHEHRTNILLINYSEPEILGITRPYTNDGIVNSWGWELSLTWNDEIGKDFRYHAGMNLSFNDNKVIERGEEPKSNAYQMAKGHRLGARGMYKFWKYYYEGAEADYEKEFGSAFPTQFISDIKPGDAIYVDLNKDGKVDANDLSYDLGHTDDPRYMIGFNIGLSWKRLSVNTQWTGAWDVSRMISGVFRFPFYGKTTRTQGGLLKYIVGNSWTTENPSQSAEYPRASWAAWDQNYSPNSSLYEKDSKYLRLKTLQIAYDFKFPLMKKMGLNQLQLAFSGYNLLTFTPYKWGDPESRASSSPTYPLQRTYMMTLKVGF